jgi:hypothetical protein
MYVRYLVRKHGNGIEEKGEWPMSKTKGVSSKTHTQKQLDDYANQHNPNNKAYWANRQNQKAMSRKKRTTFYLDDYTPADWFCYSNPYDFD